MDRNGVEEEIGIVARGVSREAHQENVETDAHRVHRIEAITIGRLEGVGEDFRIARVDPVAGEATETTGEMTADVCHAIDNNHQFTDELDLRLANLRNLLFAVHPDRQLEDPLVHQTVLVAVVPEVDEIHGHVTVHVETAA
jgi:hypothetical protein